MERTLSIIKPDAVSRNIVGKINSYIEVAGLRIIAQKMAMLTMDQVSKFYAVHAERSFFQELVSSMSHRAVVLQVLECDDAVAVYRDIMGATDPKDARKGTIRADFALSLTENSVHGSDTVKNAIKEISFCFSEIEIVR